MEPTAEGTNGTPDRPSGPGPAFLDRFAWLEHPTFRRMALVQVTHGAGDALIAIALAGTLFFDVPIGEARDRVGLYLLIAMTPYALLSPLVGPMLDRWRDSYRIAILLSAVGRAVFAFTMAARTDRLVLYPLAFGALVLSRAHVVSRAALVPTVRPPDRTLLWTNGRLAIMALIGGALAAIPGFGLDALIGPGIVLRLAGVVFVVGGVLAYGLPKIAAGRRERVERGAHRRVPPGVVAAAFGTASLRGAIGFLTFFLAFALRAEGHGGGAFALAFLAAGFGGALGSLLASWLRRVPARAVLASALAILAVVAGVLAASFGIEVAALIAGIAAVSAALGRHAFDSLLQAGAGEEIRGRAFARYETVFQLVWVAGAGLATAIPLRAAPGLRIVTVICFVGVLGVMTGARVARNRDQDVAH